MRVYKGTEVGELPNSGAVATIGNFDGVHIGHQELLRRVVERAKELGLPSMAITFRPHPYTVVRGMAENFLLHTYDEKVRCLSALGIDCIVELKFSREFSETTPQDFVYKILKDKLRVQSLFLGYDFAFGRGRAGTVEVMRQLAADAGMETEVVSAQKVEGRTVSSSMIRKELELGSIALVNQALGRPFSLMGLVFKGEGRGHKIQVPTVNLRIADRLIPRSGVYASKVLWRKQKLASVTNIGVNPTFRADNEQIPLKIESHILDFNQDIYGEELTLEFHQFLRGEQKFSSVDALKLQISEDILQTRKILQD